MKPPSRTERQWFVMRDLKRANAKQPAYLYLSDKGFEVYTPMATVVSKCGKKKICTQKPVLQDLLFVHSSRNELDPVVELIPTLQYRYRKGGVYMSPMTVGEAEMDRFMRAVAGTPEPEILLPEQITPAMVGRRVRIEGGPLDGYEGNLLKVRGTRKRHLIVEIPDILVASVEVDPDLIRLL